MGILAVEILAIWSLVALVTGLVVGAAIREVELMHEEEFMTALFSTLETLQTSR